MSETLDLFEQARVERHGETMTVRIEFDGGTPCNVPREGYGNGYGSYRINEEKVVRVEHGKPMSNNVAEIWTLIVALRAAVRQFDPHRTRLEIVGDSTVALGRCNHAFKKKRDNRVRSQEFNEACAILRTEIGAFLSFTTTWQARKHSVATFGH